MIEQLVVVFLGAAISLSLAWLVGNTLAARLEREKKFTERDVAALTAFQELYGEFFALWKEWGNSPKDSASVARLLPGAAKVEGRYEALLVMLCADRVLSDDDRRALGALRQGLQQLREAIKKEENVDWWSPDDRHYRALKWLTAHAAVLLRPRAMGWAGQAPSRPTATDAAGALLAVTSNDFKGSWADTAYSLGLPDLDQSTRSSPMYGRQDELELDGGNSPSRG